MAVTRSTVSEELKGRRMFNEPMKVTMTGFLEPRQSIFSDAPSEVEIGQVFRRGTMEARPSSVVEQHMRSALAGNEASVAESMRVMREQEPRSLDRQNHLLSDMVVRGDRQGSWFPETETCLRSRVNAVGVQRNSAALSAPRSTEPYDEETLRLASLLKRCEEKIARKALQGKAGAQTSSGHLFETQSYYIKRHSGTAASQQDPDRMNLRSPAASFDSRSTAFKSNDSFESSASDDTEIVPEKKPTTLMMRNIPNNYTRDMLVDLLNCEGFWGAYDLVYLPMDFQTEVGLGYAFINLRSFEVAVQLQEHFQGFTSWVVQSEKVCQISWSDTHQGLRAHVGRYINSPVMHESVPDRFKPALYDQGVRVPFPSSTKIIRPPRLRKFPAKKR